MLINSVIFGVFFIIFLIPYFSFMKESRRLQNIWLLISSYFFYGWADWRMLPLLVIATIVFYYLAKYVGIYRLKNERRASCLTFFAVVLGILLLLYFKYFNFFVEGFSNLFYSLGVQTNLSSFNIILPIGISFFTFKLISYIVDTRRGQISTSNDIIEFATYIAFFPTIMSGPIDRPRLLISQLRTSRKIDSDNLSEGLKRILWGVFNKMCIADVISSYTDAIFNNLSHHNSTSIIFATLLYAFQIYADFNGYSHMAIGVSRIMGITVSENFLRPYFADSVSDFWRRWHITLSSWIRDYIYIPLGGNRKGKVRMYINQIVSMTLCGMWHGAALNFIVWGFVHGLLVCIHKFWSQTICRHNKYYHPLRWRKFCSIVSTFTIVSLVWQLFRINSLSDMGIIINQILHVHGSLFMTDPQVFTFGLLSIIIMVFKDSLDEFNLKLHFLHSTRLQIRLLSISGLIIYIILFGALEGKTFIYFQF